MIVQFIVDISVDGSYFHHFVSTWQTTLNTERELSASVCTTNTQTLSRKDAVRAVTPAATLSNSMPWASDPRNCFSPETSLKEGLYITILTFWDILAVFKL